MIETKEPQYSKRIIDVIHALWPELKSQDGLVKILRKNRKYTRQYQLIVTVPKS